MVEVDGGRFRRSVVGYLILLAILLLAKGFLLTVPVSFPGPGQEALFGWVPLLVIAGLGLVTAALYPLTDMPTEGYARDTPRGGIAVPLAVGAVLGVVLIGIDLALGFSEAATAALGVESMHVGWPGSVVVYSGAAVLVETVYRLVPVTVLVLIVGRGVMRGRWPEAVFWVVAVGVSLVEPWSQAQLFSDRTLLAVTSFLYVFASNLIQMRFFRIHGIVASYAVRWSHYAVWHMVWGGLLA